MILDKIGKNENNYISFSDKESAFIESVAEKYKLNVHDLILLSILSITGELTLAQDALVGEGEGKCQKNSNDLRRLQKSIIRTTKIKVKLQNERIGKIKNEKESIN